MGKRPVWLWLFTALVIIVGFIIEVRPLHEMVWRWVEGACHFAKENLVAILLHSFLSKASSFSKYF